MLSSIIFYVVLAFILIISFFSLRERVRLRHMREKEWDAIGESKTSAMSQAIASLVGTAGGIYLSLVVLFTFLEADVPTRVNLVGMRFEPVAAVSFALALMQPFAMRLLILSRRRY